MTSGIYTITNLITGRVYIGSAVNIFKRWAAHKGLLNKNKHHCKHLQHVWNKYGFDNFEFNVIFECHKSQVAFYEQLWIDFYGIENLYNIAPTVYSQLGSRRSCDFREKMRVINTGKIISDDTRKKIQKAQGGSPIIHIDESGNILGRYESTREASRKTNYSAAHISNSVRKQVRCKKTFFVKSEEDIMVVLQNRKLR